MPKKFYLKNWMFVCEIIEITESLGPIAQKLSLGTSCPQYNPIKTRMWNDLDYFANMVILYA